MIKYSSPVNAESLYGCNYGVSGPRQHSIRGLEAESLAQLTLWGTERASLFWASAPTGSPCGSEPLAPRTCSDRAASLGAAESSVHARASALQGGDDTSSSEGSTVDCLDPEEILRKIPELADDLEEPDDCFTEGKAAAKGLLMLTSIRARIQFHKLSSGHLCAPGPGLHRRQTERASHCLLPKLGQWRTA